MVARQSTIDVERLVVLENTSWETCERLLAEHQNPGGIRFTYDDGRMQIMSRPIRARLFSH